MNKRSLVEINAYPYLWVSKLSRSGSVLMMLALGLILSGCADNDSQSDTEAYTSSEEVEKTFDDNWYELHEAQRLAAEDGRWVQLYVYTDWCGFCQQMQEQTYTDAGVKEMLKSYYYPVSLNAESQSEVRFNENTYSEEVLAGRLGVTSYPTIFFIDSEGAVLAIENGYIEAETFRQMLEFIGTHAYEDQTFRDYSEN